MQSIKKNQLFGRGGFFNVVYANLYILEVTLLRSSLSMQFKLLTFKLRTFECCLLWWTLYDRKSRLNVSYGTCRRSLFWGRYWDNYHIEITTMVLLSCVCGKDSCKSCWNVMVLKSKMLWSLILRRVANCQIKVQSNIHSRSPFKQGWVRVRGWDHQNYIFLTKLCRTVKITKLQLLSLV